VPRRSPLPPRAKRRKPRVVVDTSVLVAGISGFREPFVQERNPSANVLHRWGERNHFVWLITEDILDEYKEVLKRLRVRPNRIGRVVNLIRERAEEVEVHFAAGVSPDPKDDPFCFCAERGRADFIVTWNPSDFPEERLRAKVVHPGFFQNEFSN
jgi:predicted nucleic acid-binding protein